MGHNDGWRRVSRPQSKAQRTLTALNTNAGCSSIASSSCSENDATLAATATPHEQLGGHVCRGAGCAGALAAAGQSPAGQRQAPPYTPPRRVAAARSLRRRRAAQGRRARTHAPRAAAAQRGRGRHHWSGRQTGRHSTSTLRIVTRRRVSPASRPPTAPPQRTHCAQRGILLLPPTGTQPLHNGLARVLKHIDVGVQALSSRGESEAGSQQRQRLRSTPCPARTRRWQGDRHSARHSPPPPAPPAPLRSVPSGNARSALRQWPTARHRRATSTRRQSVLRAPASERGTAAARARLCSSSGGVKRRIAHAATAIMQRSVDGRRLAPAHNPRTAQHCAPCPSPRSSRWSPQAPQCPGLGPPIRPAPAS